MTDMSVYIYIGMVVLVLIAFFRLDLKGLFQLIWLTLDLSIASRNKISDKACAQARADLENDSRNFPKSVFFSSVLKKQLEAYQKQYHKNPQMPGEDCDIEDYLNYDLLDNVGGRSFCEMTGSGLTALGVLGTFFGLKEGLTAFNMDEAEQVTRSIGELLSGMSIAFKTSIAGIIASLVFGIVFRMLYSMADEQLERFLKLFRRNVAVSHKNDTVSAISAALRSIEAQQDKLANGLLTSVDSIRESAEKSIADAVFRQNEMMQASVLSFTENLTSAVAAEVKGLSEHVQLFSGMVGKQTAAYSQMAEQLEAIRKQTSITLEQIAAANLQYRDFLVTVSAANKSVQQELGQIDGLVKGNTELMAQHAKVAAGAEAAVRKSVDAAKALGTSIKSLQEVSDRRMEELQLNMIDFNSYMQEKSEEYLKSTTAFLETALHILAEGVKTADDAFLSSKKTAEENQKQMQAFAAILKSCTAEMQCENQTMRMLIDKLNKSAEPERSRGFAGLFRRWR